MAGNVRDMSADLSGGRVISEKQWSIVYVIEYGANRKLGKLHVPPSRPIPEVGDFIKLEGESANRKVLMRVWLSIDGIELYVQEL